MKTNNKNIDLYKIIIPLALVGIGLALYLLYEYLAPPHQSLCYINAQINCEASTKGALANTLGIPTALWGLTGYIMILISAIRKWRRVLFGVVTFGLLFCLRITFLELFVVNAICPVCLACQTVMIILFILGIKLLEVRK
ncbi:vitamin K epoxide reductase family protein [Candidatus Gottesmanbacteria bacterium]|nr:vitamin K epoxide reductase family protein [Candidatus Gottesmanbacteria bacterium]